MNFWRNIDRRGPYKNGENLNYLKLCKELFFGKIICSTHQRKSFSTILGNFWKIEFLKEYRQGRTLQKWWKYVIICSNYLKLCKEIIFWQNYLFHSSKEVFLHNFTQFLENWIFEGISTGADLTKMVKIWTISVICAYLFQYFLAILSKLNFWRNINRRGPYKNENLNYLKLCKELFFGKIICSTHQRKIFSTILGNFWKIWIFEEISTGADLTKMVKIWTILNCAKKLFFGKIICSTHQRKCFSTTLRNFWKIGFLKEYRQARTLQKWWKFVLS